MKNIIKHRLQILRLAMEGQGLQAFVVPSTDPHCGEYVSEKWEIRKWLSGFEGSAGTVVITLKEAALWTDSRYYLEAEEALKETTIKLMREGLPQTPTIAQWLHKVLPEDAKVGMSGKVNMHSFCQEFARELAPISLETNLSPDLGIREPVTTHNDHTLRIFPLEYAGESVEEKVIRIREDLSVHGADSLLFTQLDEIAWLTNLRGNDIAYNPVFEAWCIITQKDLFLCVDHRKISEEIQAYLAANQFIIKGYDEIEQLIKEVGEKSLHGMLYDPDTTPEFLTQKIRKGIQAPSPIALKKAMKNQCELKGMETAQLKDGVAMTRLLQQIDKLVEAGCTELTVVKELERLRADRGQYQGPSFATISAYGPHGAIVHYEPTETTDAPLKPEGLLLLDAGGHFDMGTTDVTRTLPLGPLTREMCEDYTLVLKGHIALAKAKFPLGTCGTQLDVLARQYLWAHGRNYGHGTGHGVGCLLNVHEGPHQIRASWKPTPLLPGMTVTNEPGLYRAGSHGVRIENTMVVTLAEKTAFGQFLQFKPLTVCPISTEPIIEDWMTEDELAYLNDYHQDVFKKLEPFFTEPEDREWLRKQTQPIMLKGKNK